MLISDRTSITVSPGSYSDPCRGSPALSACEADLNPPCGHIGIHSLRKTAINDAIRNGASMHEVREFAGHADIRTTEVYFVRKEEDAEVAARRIQIRLTGSRGRCTYASRSRKSSPAETDVRRDTTPERELRARG